ncbi:MAG: response regulator transcription factor [Solirubrobacterales bacterium]|nr:response regulator transcription factor [Solirubrobacterales bacterium]
MTGELRLLIVDRTATRLGIRMALDGEVEVCAEAGDAEHAIRAAKYEQPDLCLIGAEIDDRRFGLVRAIARAAPSAAVVVLAYEANVEDLLESVRAGAVGYVPGPLDADRLRRIVRAVAANEAVIPRSLVLELLLELRGVGFGGEGVSTRESQVLGMLRRGHSTAEIAEGLEIAPVTVRRHISELVTKLGVGDRAALVAGARQAPGNGRSARVSADKT